MNIIESVLYLTRANWGILSFFVIISLFSVSYKPKTGRKKAKNVKMVIVSIASKGVEKALMECIDHHRRTMNLPLSVLADEGSDLIPKLQEMKIDLVIVPKEYRPDLVGKGRAMCYFIEKHVDPKYWYAFVDDDNLVFDNRWLHEIPVYENLGYAAMNPVLGPRPGNSVFAYAMDFIRYFDDVTIFRLFTGLLGRPMMGLHGELLTVKGSVLKEIGYDRHTITEDFRFASILVVKGYKTWQSATRLSIKSPNSIGDLMKQRGRWFKGVASDWQYCPPVMKLIVGMRLFIWILGIFGSWLFFALWYTMAFHWAIPAGLYYWTAYLYAIYKIDKIRYLPLIPLFGIVEALSILSGLRQKKFVVIDKN